VSYTPMTEAQRAALVAALDMQNSTLEEYNAREEAKLCAVADILTGDPQNGFSPEDVLRYVLEIDGKSAARQAALQGAHDERAAIIAIINERKRRRTISPDGFGELADLIEIIEAR
jgi:hypothetical protein